MNLETIHSMVAALWRGFGPHSGHLIPVLAAACIVTLIIAVATDGWMRQHPAPQKKPAPDKGGGELN